jgi:hypothetical protein
MTTPTFATTGHPPRIMRVEALAFHDAAGNIRHMHHSIVLEGAEPRPYRQMLDEVKVQARAMGVDVDKLRVLHVTAPFNLATRHRVDVKKGVLVELEPPKRSLKMLGAATRKRR